jgi:hypothetical protein
MNAVTKKQLLEAIKDVPDEATILIRMIWCNSPTLVDYKLNIKEGCHPVFDIIEDFSDE